MSVVRVDIPASYTHGWQARWPIAGGKKKRLSAFFADRAWGGSQNARKHAKWAEVRIKVRARLGLGA